MGNAKINFKQIKCIFKDNNSKETKRAFYENRNRED